MGFWYERHRSEKVGKRKKEEYPPTTTDLALRDLPGLVGFMRRGLSMVLPLFEPELGDDDPAPGLD